MQHLTLCMIVKDEEALLPACLASVRGLADALVVVDTGSSDRTVEIATAAGATVVCHPWQDDFAAARNAALAQVRGGFVLVLDADERLGPGAKSAIQRALQRDDFDCGLLALHDAATLDAQPTEIVAGRARRGEPVLLPRLLRRTPDLEWEGCVHEQVTGWVLRGRRVRALDATIVHYGAVPSLRAARAKNERNLRLLERRCQREPDNPTVRAYLARELERAGEPARALVEAETCWTALLSRAREGAPSCDVVLPATLLAFLALRDERPERALEVLGDAVRWSEPHPNLDLLAGWAHEQRALRADDVESFGRELAAASERFEACLAQHGRVFVAEMLPGATAHVARTRLATVQLLAGDADAALRSFAAALSEKPEHTEARLGLVEALLDAGRAVDALNELQPALAFEHPDTWLLAAACANALGHGDDALLHLERVAALLANHAWVAPHRRGRSAELEDQLRPALVASPTLPARARDDSALTLSVVIPAYNRLDLLRPVIAAFAREAARTPFELIVVDDGSNPPVARLFDGAPRPARLQLITRACNGGRGAALNTGLDAARGDIVVFCDSDIVPQPGFVDEHLAFHRERGDELATHLGALEWGVDAGLFGALVGARASPRLGRGECPVGWTRWFTDNWSFRRSLLSSRGLHLDEAFKVWGWEELELARRLTGIGATSTLTTRARGAHLKPATSEGLRGNFARSVPNLLRLARAAPLDPDVRVWLGMRCATEAALEQAERAWELLWSRALELDAAAPGALRDARHPLVERLGIACSDIVFRLGIARGLLACDDAVLCAHGVPPGDDHALGLALTAGLVALSAAEQTFGSGDAGGHLLAPALPALQLAPEKQRAL